MDWKIRIIEGIPVTTKHDIEGSGTNARTARHRIAKMSDADALATKLQEIAHCELNETPESKRTGISQLRQLISKDESLCCPTEDAFLIKFLRCRKYDVDRAFQTIKNYFQARKEKPEWFDGINLCSVSFDACCRERRIVTLSNRRDPGGRFVYEVNVGDWNTGICSLTEALRLHILCFEHIILQDEGQIMGVIIVLNYEGVGIHHLLEFTPSVVRKAIYMLQDCFPVRIKGFYVTNTPAIFKILFSISKPFLKTKLLERFRFFDNFEKMRGLVPDDIIPEAHGGTQEAFDYDKMAKDLKPCEEFLRKIDLRGYR